jgi:hypothetical protein
VDAEGDRGADSLRLADRLPDEAAHKEADRDRAAVVVRGTGWVVALNLDSARRGVSARVEGWFGASAAPGLGCFDGFL